MAMLSLQETISSMEKCPCDVVGRGEAADMVVFQFRIVPPRTHRKDTFIGKPEVLK